MNDSTWLRDWLYHTHIIPTWELLGLNVAGAATAIGTWELIGWLS